MDTGSQAEEPGRGVWAGPPRPVALLSPQCPEVAGSYASRVRSACEPRRLGVKQDSEVHLARPPLGCGIRELHEARGPLGVLKNCIVQPNTCLAMAESHRGHTSTHADFTLDLCEYV